MYLPLYSQLLLIILFFIPNRTYSQTANSINKTELIFQKSNAWQDFSPRIVSKVQSENIDYNFTVLLNNTQFGSFTISNANSTDQLVSFDISTNLSNIELFHVTQVTTSTNRINSDPLIPVDTDIVLPKNSAQLFIFKVRPSNLGVRNSTINIHNGDKVKNIPVTVNSINSKTIIDDLNTVNWAYLNYPIFENKKGIIAQDLKLHNINTYVVRPHLLPQIGEDDFSRIIDYLEPLSNIKNILLFANYNSEKNSIPVSKAVFMSESWKKDFKKWYRNMLSSLRAAGYKKENIYFYPYDEVSGHNIRKLEILYEWAKKEIPGFNLYATIDDTNVAIEIGPLIDVAQIARREYILKHLKNRKGEYWIYDTKPNNSIFSPYKYYRMMAWSAYYNGYKGIGFWNYFVAGSKKAYPTNSIIDESKKEYFMIYTDGEKIISSRRWEAFSLGVEDYRVIMLYEKKFGKEKTSELVNRVLTNQDNYDLADEIRNKMINSL